MPSKISHACVLRSPVHKKPALALYPHLLILRLVPHRQVRLFWCSLLVQALSPYIIIIVAAIGWLWNAFKIAKIAAVTKKSEENMQKISGRWENSDEEISEEKHKRSRKDSKTKKAKKHKDSKKHKESKKQRKSKARRGSIEALSRVLLR
uniref:Uncharacterized protein n=1 Tax=Ditylenchus dipsaci TaxID=166011 RepID=A0A915CQC2_9BILA